MDEKLEAAISGSFKFKPEIDGLIDEFADYNVTILEPSKGWLYIPSGRLLEIGYRPLPSERGLVMRQIEDHFLEAVRNSHFLYVNNLEGYLGNSMALEMGFALGAEKPIFVRHPLTLQNFELDLASFEFWREKVTVATPAETAAIMHRQR